MATIQYPDRGTALRVGPHNPALTQAALAALDAPSILNTQPWHWRIDGDAAELRADRDRQLDVIDPDGRLLTLSCGIALHHARVALAADGVGVDVAYLPDADDPDLFASLRLSTTMPRTPLLQRLRRAMTLRRTDRRPFADEPVPQESLDRLRDVAEAVGAHLHLARPRDLVEVTVAAGHAATVELADPAYRAELAAWVHPDNGSGDGVQPASAPAAYGRPVPIRDFSAAPEDGGRIYHGVDLADRNARYGIVFTDGDLVRDWLTAGEAVSAILLTATADGLATSPMSDLVEVIAARELLRRVLGNVGYPALVLRIGVPSRGRDAPGAPRRSASDVISYG
jgi:hypothetical protein